jgi:hypothetical protein
MNTWRDYISHKMDISNELKANFNFLMSHLTSHWAEQVCRYGALPQVITFQYCILCFEIRDLDLQALAQHQENCAAPSKVLPSGADLAAPQRPQSYAQPEFMGPQNRRDGKYPNAKIKDFRALLDDTQEAMHHAAIYCGTQEYIMHKSCTKTYILDEPLHAMELCIYHGIKVQVEGLEGERISQMC